MSKHAWWRIVPFLVTVLAIGLVSGCGRGRLAGDVATATPTKTPRPIAKVSSPPAVAAELPAIRTPEPTALPTNTAAPSPTATAIPASATPVPPTATAVPATATRVPAARAAPRPTAPPAAPPEAPTAAPRPQVDFAITELRVLGLGENNGGIEGSGAGRTIFITVKDAAGNPIDSAVIVNTAEYPGRAVSGDKGTGTGKAEILMDREVFRLKVESVNGAAVTSEVSHNLSLMDPAPADIAGKLGDACPSPDNCPLPPYKHFSYMITFQRTH